MTYTAEEKRKAVEREIGYRKYVYPIRIREGRMTQSLADEQIRIFEQIRDDYAEQEKKERLL